MREPSRIGWALNLITAFRGSLDFIYEIIVANLLILHNNT